MALIPDVLQLIKELQDRIEALEKANQSKNFKIPTGGKFVLNTESADPPAENGKIFYLSTHSLRVCINGTWRTITTS